MMRSLSIITMMAAVLAAPLAFAQQSDGPKNRESEAWLTAYDMQGGVLTGNQQQHLLTLAWHGAVANLCETLQLDHLKFGQAMAVIEHSDAASMSDDEHEFFRQSLMINYGVSVGIMLAEHADDKEAACADALEFAKDEEDVNYFDMEDLEAQN